MSMKIDARINVIYPDSLVIKSEIEWCIDRNET